MKDKVAVASLFAGGFTKKSMIWVHANHRNYCLRHGYEYIGHEETAVGNTPQEKQHWCVWRKLDIIEPLMDRFDYVLWIDADAIFYDFQKQLDGLLTPWPLCVAVNPDNRANAGVFILRSGAEAKNLVKLWRSLKPIYPRPPREPWNDTSALNYMRAECLQFNIHCVEPSALNALAGHFSDCDFIRHFPYTAHSDSATLAKAAMQYDPLATRRRSDLYSLAGKTCKRAAEIGVGQGKNAVRMMEHGHFEHLLLCDVWIPGKGGHLDQTREAVAQYGDRVQIVENSSILAAESIQDHSLDFVYIDADHSYSAVFEDIWAWHRKVRPGGIVAGHDYTSPESEPKYGVRAAVLNFYTGTEIHLTDEESDYLSSWYVFK